MEEVGAALGRVCEPLHHTWHSQHQAKQALLLQTHVACPLARFFIVLLLSYHKLCQLVSQVRGDHQNQDHARGSN